MTPAATRLLAAIAEPRDQLAQMDIEALHIATQVAVRARIEAWDSALDIVRAYLPDVEWEAARGVSDGDVAA